MERKEVDIVFENELLRRKLSLMGEDLRIQENHVARLADCEMLELGSAIMMRALNSQLRLEETLSLVPESIRRDFAAFYPDHLSNVE